MKYPKSTSDHFIESHVISRRGILRGMGAGALASLFGKNFFLEDAGAQGQQKSKFVLYVHCGSWDGWASGILQPKDVNLFPRGVFTTNSDSGSNNPNVNKHYKTGNLILNNYTKVLEGIADHVCFATGTSRSLGHIEASVIQSTGDVVKGTVGHPSWPIGLAQAMRGSAQIESSYIVGNKFSQISVKTPGVSLVDGFDLTTFRNKFVDSPKIIAAVGSDPKVKAAADEFWKNLKDLHNEKLLASAIPATLSNSTAAAIDGLLRGQPELGDDVAVVKDVRAKITREKVDALLTGTDDGAEVIKSAAYNELISKLQLAAILAKTGKASGMVIELDEQDLHRGGASVQSARSGAQVFAQLTVFWEWIKANGLHDDVMVIVSHDFSRTPYNHLPGPTENVMFAGKPTPVQSPGTDHHLAMGMIFINGKVPPSSRIGGIGDTYIAAGSTDFRGIADPNIAAYNSMQIAGSMMMRVWGDTFPNARELRRYWQSFQDTDVIPMLLT